MKKLAILLIAVSCLHATDLEKTFKDAFAIALDPEKASKFVDNAHALSDLWQFNNSYTFDMLFNEEIEWHHQQQKPGQTITPGVAMLDEKQRGIYLYLDTTGFTLPQKCFALDLTSFRVVRFDKEEVKNFRLIYPNNLPTNKMIMPGITPLAQASAEGTKLNVDLTADKTRYNLAFFSEGKLNLAITTQNTKKQVQNFQGAAKDGQTTMLFDRNDGTLNLNATVKGESDTALHLVHITVFEF